MIAVIRVRGGFKIRQEFKDTLKYLRLNKKHHCVILKETPVYLGMIKKVRDYVTWGEISEEMLKKLIEKRGRLPGNKRIDPKDVEKYYHAILNGEKTDLKPVFRLSPPKKGWKGSIKKPYPEGALGPRGDKINELLKRMI